MNTAITRGGDWWEAFELQWSHPRYTILSAPRGVWRTAWDELRPKEILAQDYPDFREPGWVFEAHLEGELTPMGWTGPQIRLRVDWPPGGIFVPERAAATEDLYEPLKEAPQILLDVQRTRPEDPAALLRFVNRWGCLGVGIPNAPDFPADGVELTGQRLAWLRECLQTLRALQRGEPSTRGWDSVAQDLSQALAGVHLAARPDRRGLVPYFPVPSLLDALVLEIWGMATGGQRLRQCPECRALFVHGREDKRYCTAVCARRRTVREWKRKHKRRTKLRGRRPRKEA